VPEASGRLGGFERPLYRAGGQGTWPSRSRIAALGKSARGWTRTDGSVTAPHNAGDAAVGGPRGENHPFAARERAVAHGARHFKNVDRDLCWNVDIRFRFIENRRADYPMTVLCDVLAVSPAGYYAWRSARRAGDRPPILTLVEDIKRVDRETKRPYGSPPPLPN